MSGSDARADLHGSFVTLSERWSEVHTQWRDDVATEFEREFWDEIVKATRSVERSAAVLEEVIEQALRRTEI